MLYTAGMPGFDAFTHAMTTLATGGFSTRTGSIGAFDNALVEWVVVFGMIVGSLPFVTISRSAVAAGRTCAATSGAVVPALVAGVVVLICIQLITRHGYALPEAIRLSAFNTVSMMTGTGYGSADFNAWGGMRRSYY